MPEIGMPRNEFVDRVRETNDSEGFVNPYTLDEVAPELKQEIVGSGDESFVLPGKNIEGNETVSAYSYSGENPLRMKEIFYVQRIYSTLFPHNFPHFYAAFGRSRQARSEKRTQDNISGTIRQRVFPSTDEKITYPLEEVREVCKTIGLPLDIEDGEHNIMTGTDGGEYYIDTVNPRFDVNKIDIAKIDEYMQDNGFSPQDIHTVHVSVERLKEINEELYS